LKNEELRFTADFEDLHHEEQGGQGDMGMQAGM
jgi:hypothetical protein